MPRVQAPSHAPAGRTTRSPLVLIGRSQMSRGSKKYRYKVLHCAMREPIWGIIRQACAEMGVYVVKGVPAQDHAHMFMSLPPHIALSKVMQRIKGYSSRRVQSESFQNRVSTIGADGFGPVDIVLPNQAMSPTTSSSSIRNCIPNAMRPASACSPVRQVSCQLPAKRVELVRSCHIRRPLAAPGPDCKRGGTTAAAQRGVQGER